MSEKSFPSANTCPYAAHLTEVIPVQEAAEERLIGQNRADISGSDRRMAEMGLRTEVANMARDIVQACRGCDAAGVFLSGVVECPSRPIAKQVLGAAAQLDNPHRPQ